MAPSKTDGNQKKVSLFANQLEWTMTKMRIWSRPADAGKKN